MIELKSPMLRDRFPDTFQPLSTPISDENIQRAVLHFRKAIGRSIRHNHGKGIKKEELFKLMAQVITFIWGPSDKLPSDEYLYLIRRIFYEFRKPLQYTLRLGSLRGKNVLFIGPTTSEEK